MWATPATFAPIRLGWRSSSLVQRLWQFRLSGHREGDTQMIGCSVPVAIQVSRLDIIGGRIYALGHEGGCLSAALCLLPGTASASTSEGERLRGLFDDEAGLRPGNPDEVEEVTIDPRASRWVLGQLRTSRSASDGPARHIGPGRRSARRRPAALRASPLAGLDRRYASGQRCFRTSIAPARCRTAVRLQVRHHRCRQPHRRRPQTAAGVPKAGPISYRLFELLSTTPRFSVEQVHQRMATTFPTAGVAVNLLDDLGILTEITGQNKNRVYSFPAKQVQTRQLPQQLTAPSAISDPAPASAGMAS